MTEGALCLAKKRVLKSEFDTDYVRRHILGHDFLPYELDWLYEDWKFLSIRHNILTNHGRDYLHTQGYITPAVTTVLNFIGLSADAGAPAATDIDLSAGTGEITTNGLARSTAVTGTHSVNTNTSTLAYTWTATGTTNSVQKCALFTASSGGTMANETTFSSTNMVNTDQLSLTFTITLG